MKKIFKKYCSVTLDQYINESKSITLKRKYGDRNSVVVGVNAPIRNQILSYVAESVKVGAIDLKRFIAGLNETNANPNAAANMWLRRNGKFFIAESKGGRTFYKLSNLGQRLVNRFTPKKLSENFPEEDFSEKDFPEEDFPEEDFPEEDFPEEDFSEERISPQEFNNFVRELIRMPDKEEASRELKNYLDAHPYMHEELGEIEGRDMYKEGMDIFMDYYQEEMDSYYNEEISESKMKNLRKKLSKKLSEKKKYDFKDPKTDKPGIYDEEDEDVEECLGTDKKGLTESRKKRIEKIIENIRSKKEKSLNEAEDEEEKEKDKDEGDEAADELSFDDLDLSGEEGEEKEEKEEKEEGEDEEDKEKEKEEGEEGEEEEEKVEIIEFIITVDDVDSAISELEELEVDASKVIDPEGEPEEGEEEVWKENEISVPAEQWDNLKGWLEDKGVDVEEMFGGEIEVEDVEDEGEEELEVDIEDEDEELDLDLGGEEEGSEELELELEDEEKPEIEESITGMEREEKENTPNLVKGAKEITIKYR